MKTARTKSSIYREARRAKTLKLREANLAVDETETKLKERVKALYIMIVEMFSPPRVVPHAVNAGMKLGWSLDIQAVDPFTGCKWDLSDPKQQKRVLRFLATKPYLLIFSLPCTMFSQLQKTTSLRARQVGTHNWRRITNYCDSVCCSPGCRYRPGATLCSSIPSRPTRGRSQP